MMTPIQNEGRCPKGKTKGMLGLFEPCRAALFVSFACAFYLPMRTGFSEIHYLRGDNCLPPRRQSVVTAEKTFSLREDKTMMLHRTASAIPPTSRDSRCEKAIYNVARSTNGKRNDTFLPLNNLANNTIHPQTVHYTFYTNFYLTTVRVHSVENTRRMPTNTSDSKCFL